MSCMSFGEYLGAFASLLSRFILLAMRIVLHRKSSDQDYHSERKKEHLELKRCVKNTHLKTPFTLPLLLPGRAL